jgi:hypothetical protein
MGQEKMKKFEKNRFSSKEKFLIKEIKKGTIRLYFQIDQF